jgi:hypothetical protein
VTATGEKAEDGFDWKKPKPFSSSPGMRLRKLTSLTSMTSRMRFFASSALMPASQSSTMTATSASKSQPQASSLSGMASRGPRKISLPPWYMSGSVQKLSGILAPRAWRTSATWFT